MKRIFFHLTALLTSSAMNMASVILLTLALCAQQGASQTYTIGGVNYTACGGTETVVAPFNTSAGGVTAGQYSGMVLLTVSGTGYAGGSTVSDAFYFNVPSAPFHPAGYYELVTTIDPSVALNLNDDAYKHIVYDVTAGTAVTPPYTPAYRLDHTYSFIINMSTLSPPALTPTQLRLGVNDGNFGDNGGSYTALVTQLCAPPPCSDSDGDGICDEDDNCPDDANANQTDADGDGTGDVCDGCPGDAGKTSPGICGCGVVDTDSDGDGTANCFDGCPADPNKVAPGQCGCGNADTDTDSDSVADCVDADDDNDGCLDANDSNPLIYSADADCDGIHNDCDACPGGDDSGPCNASSFPGFGNIPPDWICGNNNNKVYICHNGNTLCISPNAVQAHLNHGDFLGPCTSCGGQNLIAPGSNGGLVEMAEFQEFEMFPNPAGSEVTFHLHGFDGEAAELTVFDYSGRIVWQKTMEEGQHELTLDLSGSAFGSGIYLVKVSSGKGMLTKWLVVSK